MQSITNKVVDKWLHPWDIKKHDNLYERDERFFSILVKGTMSWLTRNMVLYGEPILHYIFNTGSSVMYLENNGYEYKEKEATGEDWIYHRMPRCVCEMQDISVPQEELSNPFVRGVYERRSGDDIVGYNSEIRRLPVELSFHLHYVLSNMNEGLILLEEIVNKLTFQQYFNIVFLGQVIECSIEHDGSNKIEINKIDMTSTETNVKSIDFNVKVCSNYPVINERAESPNRYVMGDFGAHLNIHRDIHEPRTDQEIYRFEKPE